jgi:hypothetical protein
MYERTSQGLKLPFAGETLSQRISPVPAAHHGSVEIELRSALKQRFGEKIANDAPTFNSFIDCLMNYLRREQAIVKAACETQRFINRQLGRKAPKRAFTASDINLYSLLIGDVKKLPLISELFDEVFNLHLVVTENNIEISDRIAS